jgi:hypothetical protein
MARSSHPPRLDYSNYTWRRVQTMKLLLMQFSSGIYGDSSSALNFSHNGYCLAKTAIFRNHSLAKEHTQDGLWMILTNLFNIVTYSPGAS